MNPKPSMTFIESIKTCYSKYFDFTGRARRSEFWWFYLFSTIVNGVLFAIVRTMHTAAAEEFTKDLTLDNLDEMYAKAEALDSQYLIYYIVVAVIGLFLFSIPLIAAQVRRLHDVGKTGHLMWLYLICGVGGLVPLILCIPDGQPIANEYGPSPKYEDSSSQPFTGQ